VSIPDVCLIDDVARILKTSVRTIKRRLRCGAFPIPELPSIDKKHRWSGESVRRYVAGEDVSMKRSLRRVG
jgi:hypothetical protein